MNDINQEFTLYSTNTHENNIQQSYYIYAPKKIRTKVSISIIIPKDNAKYLTTEEIVKELNQVIKENNHDVLYVYMELPIIPNYYSTDTYNKITRLILSVWKDTITILNNHSIEVNPKCKLIINDDKILELANYIEGNCPLIQVEDIRNKINIPRNYNPNYDDSGNGGAGPGLSGGAQISNSNTVNKPKILVKAPPKPHGFSNILLLSILIIAFLVGIILSNLLIK